MTERVRRYWFVIVRKLKKQKRLRKKIEKKSKVERAAESLKATLNEGRVLRSRQLPSSNDDVTPAKQSTVPVKESSTPSMTPKRKRTDSSQNVSSPTEAIVSTPSSARAKRKRADSSGDTTEKSLKKSKEGLGKSPQASPHTEEGSAKKVRRRSASNTRLLQNVKRPCIKQFGVNSGGAFAKSPKG